MALFPMDMLVRGLLARVTAFRRAARAGNGVAEAEELCRYALGYPEAFAVVARTDRETAVEGLSCWSGQRSERLASAIENLVTIHASRSRRRADAAWASQVAS